MQKKHLKNSTSIHDLKTLTKVDIEETSQHYKAICDKLTANIILNGEHIKDFPLKSGTRQGCPLLPFPFNTVLQLIAIAIRQGKEIRGIQIGKEKVKLSLYANDMILYVENPKDSTQKLLELINQISRVAAYKINIQKSVAFLCINSEISERESKRKIPFKITSKKEKNT